MVVKSVFAMAVVGLMSTGAMANAKKAHKTAKADEGKVCLVDGAATTKTQAECKEAKGVWDHAPKAAEAKAAPEAAAPAPAANEAPAK